MGSLIRYDTIYPTEITIAGKSSRNLSLILTKATMKVSIEKYTIRRIWLNWSRMGVCDWN